MRRFHLKILSELDRLNLIYGLLEGFEIGLDFALTGGMPKAAPAFGVSFDI